MIKRLLSFTQAIRRPSILLSGLKVSIFVGTLLNLINQWDYLFSGQGVMLDHLLLNYLVPFCVSVYSGAKALATDAVIGDREATLSEPDCSVKKNEPSASTNKQATD